MAAYSNSEIVRHSMGLLGDNGEQKWGHTFVGQWASHPVAFPLILVQLDACKYSSHRVQTVLHQRIHLLPFEHQLPHGRVVADLDGRESNVAILTTHVKNTPR